MTPTVRPGVQIGVPVCLGAWAAAFALAPTPQTKLFVVLPAVFGALVWWVLLSPERWLTLFFICSLLLPPLPIPAGNSGVHIAPFVALLGLMAGILNIAEWRPRPGSLPVLLLVFLAVLAQSSALAAIYSGPQIALGSLARVFLFAIGVFVFLYALAGPRRAGSNPIAFARLLFCLGVAGALFACIDFYYQLPAPAGFGPQYVWIGQNVFRRAQGFFYEASTLGNFCAFFLVMVLVSLFQPKAERVFSRPILALGGFVFFAALILSSSRASLVAVVVAAGAFVILRRLSMRRALIALCAGLSIAAVLVRIALPGFSANYWSRIAASVQYLASSPNGVLSGRLTSWNTLADFLGEHPGHLLFGIGYKTIPYTDFLGPGLVADNTYLSLLVETGIVGLLVFALLNVAILRTSFRAARSAGGRASFFGTWIFCFWCGEIVQMFSGDLITYWRVLPLYFWVLATAARETEV